MWESSFRQDLIILVYQYLFTLETGTPFTPLLVEKNSNIKNLDESLDAIIDKEITTKASLGEDLYILNKESYDSILHNIIQDMGRINQKIESSLKDSAKTFLLTKASLIVAIFEIDQELQAGHSEVLDADKLDSLIKKYVRFNEKYIGGGSAKVVHAVLAKLYNPNVSKLDKTT